MLPYWMMFAILAFGTLVAVPGGTATRNNPMLVFAVLLIAVMIGTRYEVGGDWTGYVQMFKVAHYWSYSRQMGLGDPGYQSINWIVAQAGGEFWMVNTICGLIFGYGLWRLARQQAEPWLAVLIAFPYLAVVVAMGYSRQGVAIGILMAGLADVSKRQSFVRFVFYVAAASLFHSTAVLALPLALFGSQKSRLLNVLLMGILGLVVYWSIFSGHIDHFLTNYVKAEYKSQGATTRMIMNLVPAIAFVTAGKRMGFTEFEYGMWRNFAVASFILTAALFVVPSTTAIDRLALYILPIQIAVLSRVPKLLQADLLPRVSLVAYASTILFVWLNFADNSWTWLPYKSYLWL